MMFRCAKTPVQKPLRRRDSFISNTTTVKKGMNEEGAIINQYVIMKQLGKGSFARVFLCKNKTTGERFAIKKMNKKTLKYLPAGYGKTALDCVREELNIL